MRRIPSRPTLCRGPAQLQFHGHVDGQPDLNRKLLIALLADGHLLVEGAPGLAKTRAVKALAGAIEARKTCGPLNFVTVALDHVVFHKPVFLGDLLRLYTETLKVGRTSLTTRIIVEAQRVDSGETVRVTEADVVYVAVDKDWKPVPVG